MADNSEALRQARQADTATRVARCETVLNRMVKAGETITVAKLARRAGVGEKFASPGTGVGDLDRSWR